MYSYCYDGISYVRVTVRLCDENHLSSPSAIPEQNHQILVPSKWLCVGKEPKAWGFAERALSGRNIR
jgi:hypothetical protein